MHHEGHYPLPPGRLLPHIPNGYHYLNEKKLDNPISNSTATLTNSNLNPKLISLAASFVIGETQAD